MKIKSEDYFSWHQEDNFFVYYSLLKLPLLFGEYTLQTHTSFSSLSGLMLLRKESLTFDNQSERQIPSATQEINCQPNYYQTHIPTKYVMWVNRHKGFLYHISINSKCLSHFSLSIYLSKYNDQFIKHLLSTRQYAMGSMYINSFSNYKNSMRQILSLSLLSL